jgi:hypothetical protein
MELSKIETQVVESLINEVQDQQVRELGELQLALIGGGIGDVVFI